MRCPLLKGEPGGVAARSTAGAVMDVVGVAVRMGVAVMMAATGVEFGVAACIVE